MWGRAWQRRPVLLEARGMKRKEQDCLTSRQLLHDEERENGIRLGGIVDARMMPIEDPLHSR